MRAKLILTNWTLSLMGLSIDTESSPTWAWILMLGWFASSTLLLKYAIGRGWVNC